MQWYYVVKGERCGPVSEEDLRARIQDGTIKAGDLVWNETMGQQWAKAESVPSLFIPKVSRREVSDVSTTVPAGAGALTPNRELMAQARLSLAGNWGISIAVFLVAGLIVGGLGAIPCAGSVITLLIGGAFQLGTTIFFLALSRRLTVEFGMLFAGFKHYVTSLAAYLLVTLFMILWILVPLIPGVAISCLAYYLIAGGTAAGTIEAVRQNNGLMVVFVFFWSLLAAIAGTIAALRYALTYFVIADDPFVGALGAIRQSTILMRNNKWKLFCLGWRFFGWIILCALTCGIGFLWLVPYIQTSMARFYDDVKASPA